MSLPIHKRARVVVTGDHPWTGHRAEVISGPSGLLRTYRCALIRDDELNGHEFYARPDNLEIDA